MSIFANPMMLMMGFSLIMIFALPRMMSNMDPEILKEINEKSKSNAAMLTQPQLDMPDVSQGLANFFQPKSASTKK